MSNFSVCPCSSLTFLEMNKCFRDGLHLAVGLWGQRGPVPCSALHLWACCTLGKHKCLWKIQEGKTQRYSTSEGSSSTPFPLHGWNDSGKSRFRLFFFASLLTLRKCEETSRCLSIAIAFSPGQYWDEGWFFTPSSRSLPKCNDHIKGSVPFFYFYFFLPFRMR